MLDICIGLLKDTIDFVVKKKEINEHKKMKISLVLEEISDIVKNTAESLSKDEYPHFNCSLMEKMSDRLHFYLIDYVPQEQLDELHGLLKESSQIEKQFTLRKEKDTIPKLYEASASLKSISLLLKI